MQQEFCQYTEGTADFVFGAIVVVAGLVGTPIGGWVFDLKLCHKKTEETTYVATVLTYNHNDRSFDAFYGVRFCTHLGPQHQTREQEKPFGT